MVLRMPRQIPLHRGEPEELTSSQALATTARGQQRHLFSPGGPSWATTVLGSLLVNSVSMAGTKWSLDNLSEVTAFPFSPHVLHILSCILHLELQLQTSLHVQKG